MLKYLTLKNDGSCAIVSSMNDFEILGWKDTSKQWKETIFENKGEWNFIELRLIVSLTLEYRNGEFDSQSCI